MSEPEESVQRRLQREVERLGASLARAELGPYEAEFRRVYELLHDARREIRALYDEGKGTPPEVQQSGGGYVLEREVSPFYDEVRTATLLGSARVLMMVLAQIPTPELPLDPRTEWLRQAAGAWLDDHSGWLLELAGGPPL